MINDAFPDPAELVRTYIEQVQSGSRATCKLERYGVERYLNDRKNPPTGCYFDESIARLACQFFPRALVHSIGEWAGEPFVLAPWQAFVTWQLQGWRRADTKTRRFRKCYVTVAKKQGKTTWAAGLMCLILYFDDPIEPGGRGFCAATKSEQAALLWHEARRMIQKSPSLAVRSNVRGASNKTGGIIYIDKPADTELRVISGDDTNNGINPSIVVKDEVCDWKDRHRELHDTLSSAGGSRRQSCEIIITTAGTEDSEIWLEEDRFAERVLQSSKDGACIDDSVLAFIARAEAEDDPHKLQTWQKAAPNLGISVSREYYQFQSNEARHKPEMSNLFTRYHLNRLSASYHREYPHETWRKGNQSFPREVRNGDYLYCGLDLGRSNDWAALTCVWPCKVQVQNESDPVTIFRIRSYCWCCQGPNSKIDYSREPFTSWIRDGRLTFQHGEDEIDYSPIKQKIVEFHAKYQLKQLCFDPTFAAQLAKQLWKDYGVRVMKYNQNATNYTAPILGMRRALHAGRIAHEGCQMLAWQAKNAELRTDPTTKGMTIVKPDTNRKYKIDAVVAMLMAMDPALFDADSREQKGSVAVWA